MDHLLIIVNEHQIWGCKVWTSIIDYRPHGSVRSIIYASINLTSILYLLCRRRIPPGAKKVHVHSDHSLYQLKLEVKSNKHLYTKFHLEIWVGIAHIWSSSKWTAPLLWGKRVIKWYWVAQQIGNYFRISDIAQGKTYRGSQNSIPL